MIMIITLFNFHGHKRELTYLKIISPDKKTTDEYVFNCNVGTSIVMEVSVKRPKKLSSKDELSNINKLPNINQKVSIPILNIFGQTLIDGNDIGNMIFIIKDAFCF